MRGASVCFSAWLLAVSWTGTLLAQSGYVEADGARLFYRSFGSGEPVIVLHGGPSPGHDYLLPWMTRLADRFRLIVYDHRGTGRSTRGTEEEALTRQLFVEDVERVRERLDLGRVHLVGHSWGGLLAIEYALAHPERLRSLVLIGTTEPGERYAIDLGPIVEQRRPRRDSLELAELFGSEEYRAGEPATLDRIYQLVYRPWFGRPEIADSLTFEVDGASARKGRETARLVDRNSRPPRHWDDLDHVPVPTLVIHGERDPIPIEMARELARVLPEGRFFLVPGSGHFPFAESPDVVFPALRSFLSTAP